MEMLKVGMFTGLLATLVSALAVAIVSGAGTDASYLWGWAAVSSRLTPSLWDLVKATVLLLPITGVSCGPFGVMAGMVGAWVMRRRRASTRSRRQYFSRAAWLGLFLGFVFPFYDLAMNRFGVRGATVLVLTAPFFGIMCALVTARVFRGHYAPVS